MHFMKEVVLGNGYRIWSWKGKLEISLGNLELKKEVENYELPVNDNEDPPYADNI